LVLNRRKKIIKKLQKKDKKANAKFHKSSKPVYVSKAEREKLAERAASDRSSNEQPITEPSITEQADSGQRDKEQLDNE
jgi:hypothetical protein